MEQKYRAMSKDPRRYKSTHAVTGIPFLYLLYLLYYMLKAFIAFISASIDSFSSFCCAAIALR